MSDKENIIAALTTYGAATSAAPVGGATSAKQDAQSVLIGAVNETAPASDTASSGVNGRQQRIAQNITTLSGLVATAAKQPSLGTAGSASSNVLTVQGIASMTALKTDGSAVTQPVSGTVTANAGSGTFAVSAASLPLPSGAATSANQPTLQTGAETVSSFTATPTSTVLTRPADTTAYAVGDLVASSTTAGSVVVQSFIAARYATGSGSLRRVRLYTSATSGMASIGLKINFWSAAPVYTNGDNGAYVVTTGAANFLGSATITSFNQFSDGAVAVAVPDNGAEINFALASGQTVYWDLQTTTALTPGNAQTFTLVPEILQN